MAEKKDVSTAAVVEKKENKLLELYKKYKEIINYIVVGGMTTLVRWGTTPLFEELLSPLGFKSFALSFFTTFLSLTVTILFAFPPNKIFVFESKSFKGKIIATEFVSFIAARAVASVLELAGVPLLVKLGINYPLFGSESMIATMLVSIFVLVANYLFSKLVVFKNRTSRKAQQKERERELKKAKKEAEEKGYAFSENQDKPVVAVPITRKDKIIGWVLTAICAVVFLGSSGYYLYTIVCDIIAKFA